MANDKRHLKLRYWRQKLGLQQGDMAKLLGYTAGNYSQKENGKREFYLGEMVTILTMFNKLLVKNGQPELTLDEIFLD